MSAAGPRQSARLLRGKRNAASHGGRLKGRAGAAWWFVAPALVVIGVFFFVPVLAALAMSLTDFDIYALASLANLRFVGLGNYARLLETPLFWQAFGNTLYFVAVGVPLSIAASLGDAAAAPDQLLLGGDNGLRGYPLRYQSGDRRALFTIEERAYTDWYPFRLVRVGGAVFYDPRRRRLW